MGIQLIHRQINVIYFSDCKLHCCFKGHTFNYTLIFELCYFSFGERLLFAVLWGHVFPFDNPVDSHAVAVSERPGSVVKMLIIGWNVHHC